MCLKHLVVFHLAESVIAERTEHWEVGLSGLAELHITIVDLAVLEAYLDLHHLLAL